jgi:hypothetical protein
VDEAAALLEADGALIYLLDESGELQLRHHTAAVDEPGREWIRDLRLRPGSGMVGLAVAERQVVATGDDRTDTSFVHTRASHMGLAGMRARAERLGGTLSGTPRPAGGP